MYKTIVFDLDGTLLDTLDDLFLSVNFALSKFGLPQRRKEEIRAFVGNGILKLIERATGEIEPTLFQKVFAEFKSHYGEHCQDHTKPYEGVMEMLLALRTKGIRTAVLSNKADFATKKLSAAYFGDLIEVAVGENEAMGIRKKPAPDSLYAVMKALDASKESTVYVGDSEVDIQTARNAGVDCISVTWGFKDREFLLANGATKLIDQPKALMEFSEAQIGNTPLKKLKILNGNVFVKCENENGGGSIKDRVAQAIIDDAEARGLLCKGGTVIEATSGNTGIGLALVARARGYNAVIVMPDSMTVERRQMIANAGGMVELTDGKLGMQGAVERANALVKERKNCVLADQFNNPACAKVHYEKTGVEIWAQMEEKVDIFVACVGTGGTLSGVGRFLKEKNPAIKVIAVEPSRSPLLSEGKAGAHGIQGIGANFIPTVLDRTVYDEVVTVTDEEAFEYARLLKEKEGLFVGISSGAAVAAAIKVAERAENKGKRIVTILPDSGDRYTSVL